MNAERILEEIADKQGWNESTKLDLCLQYISNQCDDSSFEDFLKRLAYEENEENP